MLQQILKDNFIDPELLAELDEEQKQVLFCKMRENQIKLWTDQETKLEAEEKNKPKKKPKPNKKGCQVGFLEDVKGEPWTWVMGDHKNDRTIEEILEDDTQEQARQLAEKEADALRDKEDGEMQVRLHEEEKGLQEEAMHQQEQLRKQQEEAAREDEESRRLDQEKEQQLIQIKEKHEMRRRTSIDMVEQLKRRRSMEIYTSMKEQRELMQKLSEEQCPRIENEWQAQEEKSRNAEREMQEIVRRARLEAAKTNENTNAKNMKMTEDILNALSEGFTGGEERLKPALPARPSNIKPPQSKPKNRAAVVNWYRTVQYPLGSGLDPATGQISPWFHGIISRQEAEDLLEEREVGAYLVRVSERIWGYTISYQGATRCKHFLIDTSNKSFHFFGDNQIRHPSLAALVEFHKTRPISSAGQETLLYPCQQITPVPNYQELVQGLRTTLCL